MWFQNRRMKDKRQRIAVTWPYAAVYSDPAFAASLLQAAANSVSMPYYAPNPQLSIIPPEASHQYAYGYHRYMPYPMLHRNIGTMPSLAHSHISPLSTPPNETVFTRLDSCLENDYFENSSSPSNSLSSLSDVEKVKFHPNVPQIDRIPMIVYVINLLFDFLLFSDANFAKFTFNIYKSNKKFK